MRGGHGHRSHSKPNEAVQFHRSPSCRSAALSHVTPSCCRSKPPTTCFWRPTPPRLSPCNVKFREVPAALPVCRRQASVQSVSASVVGSLEAKPETQRCCRCPETAARRILCLGGVNWQLLNFFDKDFKIWTKCIGSFGRAVTPGWFLQRSTLTNYWIIGEWLRPEEKNTEASQTPTSVPHLSDHNLGQQYSSKTFSAICTALLQ